LSNRSQTILIGLLIVVMGVVACVEIIWGDGGSSGSVEITVTPRTTNAIATTNTPATADAEGGGK